MFQTIKNAIKGVLNKMGLTKELESIKDFKEYVKDDGMTESIAKWQAVYMDKVNEWNYEDVKTIQGGTKQCETKRLNIAKTIASEMANIVFSEKVSITTDDEGFNDFLEHTLSESGFYSAMQTRLEYMFALGGMVIKPYVTHSNEIRFVYVNANNFVPTHWKGETVSGGLFINVVNKGKKRYTHIEQHKPTSAGQEIKHHLYVTDDNSEKIGNKVSIKELYDDMQDAPITFTSKRPLFSYIKPNIANNINMESAQGVSIYNDALQLIEMFNRMLNSLDKEFKLGKKRIIVPSYMIKTVIDTTGDLPKPLRYFDANDEVYEALYADDQTGAQPKEVTSTLRVSEHIEAMNYILRVISVTTGFSEGTFSFDGKSMKTATEIVSENSKTYRSKQSHENVLELGLKNMVHAIAFLANAYGLANAGENLTVNIGFDDSIAQDDNSERMKQIELLQAGLTSKVRAIMATHKLSRTEAEKLLQEINSELINEPNETEAFDNLFGDS